MSCPFILLGFLKTQSKEILTKHALLNFSQLADSKLRHFSLLQSLQTVFDLR